MNLKTIFCSNELTNLKILTQENIYNKSKIEDLQVQLEQSSSFIKSMQKQDEEDVNNADYWNDKWTRSDIWYRAPNRVLVNEYLKYREIKEVTEIAKELLKQNPLNDNVPLAVMKWLNEQFNKKEFRYSSS